MNTEFLVNWIKAAEVDKYTRGNKEVFVATKNNQQLILTCNRIPYPHGLHPHTSLVWIDNGTSELLFQDIVDDIYGQIMHSTGNLEGESTVHESLETVWQALVGV